MERRWVIHYWGDQKERWVRPCVAGIDTLIVGDSHLSKIPEGIARSHRVKVLSLSGAASYHMAEVIKSRQLSRRKVDGSPEKTEFVFEAQDRKNSRKLIVFRKKRSKCCECDGFCWRGYKGVLAVALGSNDVLANCGFEEILQMRIKVLISTILEMSANISKLILIGVPAMPTLDRVGRRLRTAYESELRSYVDDPQKIADARTYLDNVNMSVRYVESPWPSHKSEYRGCHAIRRKYAVQLLNMLR